MATALATASRGRRGTRKGQTRRTARKAYAPRKRAASRKPSTNYKQKYENMLAKGRKTMDKYKEGMSTTVAASEMQLALGGAAFAAGYLGPTKMRIWNSPLGDARLLAGGALVGWGLVQAFDGSTPKMQGNHVLALGSGLLGSVVYETAHNMGLDLAAKRGQVTLAAAHPAGTRGKIQGYGAEGGWGPGIGEGVPSYDDVYEESLGREVYVTPAMGGRPGLRHV